jgi:hypothetical protein
VVNILDIVAEGDKISVQLKPVGDAPVLKMNKIKVKKSNKFMSIHQYLRDTLKTVLKESDQLVWINIYL